MRNRQAGSLSSGDLAPVLRRLKRTNDALARALPGESGERQPVHTVYGGAHLFKSDTASRLGTVARYGLVVAVFGVPSCRPPGFQPSLYRVLGGFLP